MTVQPTPRVRRTAQNTQLTYECLSIFTFGVG